MSQQAQGADNTNGTVILLTAIFTGMFLAIPMYVIAFGSTWLLNIWFFTNSGSDHSGLWFQYLPSNPMYFGFFGGWLVVGILYVVTLVKGWWSVNVRAGRAITTFESKTHKLRLYGYMTLLLTLVMFLIKLAL